MKNIILISLILLGSCSGSGIFLTNNLTDSTEPTSGELSGSAISGTLDTSFGLNGVYTHTNAYGATKADIGKKVATDSSGNIYISGYSISDADVTLGGIWKLDSSGALDTSFNGSGEILTYIPVNWVPHDYNDIIIDSNDMIIATGTANNNADWLLSRHDSNGNLDTTFGENYLGTKGMQVFGLASGPLDYAKATAIDANDMFIVAGICGLNSNDATVVRFDSLGTGHDPSFASGGFFMDNNTAGGNGRDEANDLVIDSNNNIIVVGTSAGAGTGLDMVIWRLDNNGALDTTFNSTGIVIHDNAAGGNGDDVALAVALDSSENIIIVGYSEGTNGEDLTLWKYTSSGSLDTTFGGGDGIVSVDDAAGGLYNGNDRGYDLLIDSDGSIFVTGYSEYDNSSRYKDMVVLKFDNTGTLDSDFGTNGIFAHHNAAGGSGDDVGYSIAQDSSNKLVIAGESTGVSPDMTVWRLE